MFMIKKSKKRLIILLVATLVLSSLSLASAATDNRIDRIPNVRIDHVFTDSAQTPRLIIEEYTTGEFGGQPQSFQLILENAEWDDADRAATDTTFSGDAEGISIRRISSRRADVTLTPSETVNELAVWRIPLYTKATAGTFASVRIDPRGSLVTAGKYPFARVVGDADAELKASVLLPDGEPLQLEPGDRVGEQQGLYLQFEESRANVIPERNMTFLMDLEKAKWLEDGQTGLDAAAMLRNIEITGSSQIEVTRLERISDERLEISFRSTGFSDNPATISVPLYFEATDQGDINLVTTRRANLQDRFTSILAISADSIDEEEPEEPAEPVEPIEPTTREIVFSVEVAGYWENNAFVQTDAAPYIKDVGDGLGRIMVPVRFVSMATGADDVGWNPEEQLVTVRKDDTTLQLTIGSNQLFRNGEVIVMDTPAEIQDIGGGLGRTMIPVAHLARALDVEYEWDASTRTVTFHVIIQ